MYPRILRFFIHNTLVNALFCFFSYPFPVGRSVLETRNRYKKNRKKHDPSISVTVKRWILWILLGFYKKNWKLCLVDNCKVGTDKIISFALLKVRKGSKTGLFHHELLGLLNSLPGWYICTVVPHRVYFSFLLWLFWFYFIGWMGCASKF
jgi:hypothetical protein